MKKESLLNLGERLKQEMLNAAARASSAGFQSLSRDLRKVAAVGQRFVSEVDTRLRDFENSIQSTDFEDRLACEKCGEVHLDDCAPKPKKKKHRKGR